MDVYPQYTLATLDQWLTTYISCSFHHHALNILCRLTCTFPAGLLIWWNVVLNNGIYTEREFYMPLRTTPVCLQADNSLISVYIDSSYMVRIFELATYI